MAQKYKKGDNIEITYKRWEDGMVKKKKGEIIYVKDKSSFKTWMDKRSDDKESECQIRIEEDDTGNIFTVTIEKSGNHVIRMDPSKEFPHGEVRKVEII